MEGLRSTGLPRLVLVWCSVVKCGACSAVNAVKCSVVKCNVVKWKDVKCSGAILLCSAALVLCGPVVQFSLGE